MKTLQLAVFVLAANFAVAATLEGEVVKVSDGDTVHVLSDGQKSKIRLDRIDAPESKQEYCKEAAKYLADLILGKTVTVVYDKNDRYGRMLGIIFMDGLEINLEMVASGNAWHYRQFDKTIAYCDAERMAREKELGLWANPSPICPQEWRRRNEGLLRGLSPKGIRRGEPDEKAKCIFCTFLIRQFGDCPRMIQPR